MENNSTYSKTTTTIVTKTKTNFFFKCFLICGIFFLKQSNDQQNQGFERFEILKSENSKMKDEIELQSQLKKKLIEENEQLKTQQSQNETKIQFIQQQNQQLQFQIQQLQQNQIQNNKQNQKNEIDENLVKENEILKSQLDLKSDEISNLRQSDSKTIKELESQLQQKQSQIEYLQKESNKFEQQVLFNFFFFKKDFKLIEKNLFISL